MYIFILVTTSFSLRKNIELVLIFNELSSRRWPLPRLKLTEISYENDIINFHFRTRPYVFAEWRAIHIMALYHHFC